MVSEIHRIASCVCPWITPRPLDSTRNFSRALRPFQISALWKPAASEEVPGDGWVTGCSPHHPGLDPVPGTPRTLDVADVPVRRVRLFSILAGHTSRRFGDRFQSLGWNRAATCRARANRDIDELALNNIAVAAHCGRGRKGEPRRNHTRFVRAGDCDRCLEPQVRPLVIRLRRCRAAADRNEVPLRLGGRYSLAGVQQTVEVIMRDQQQSFTFAQRTIGSSHRRAFPVREHEDEKRMKR